MHPVTGEVLGRKVRQGETEGAFFWLDIFEKTDFKEFIKKQFTIGYKSEVSMDEIVDETPGE